MLAKYVLAVSIVVLAHGFALADVFSECSSNVESELKLRACSEIIENPVFGPNEKAIAYRNRGDIRTSAGAFDSAISDYTRSIQFGPASASALSGRGLAKSSSGDLAGAIADYNEAIRLSAASADLHIERGYVHLAAGNVDASLADFTKAIRLNPNSASAYNNRGLAYRKKGDTVRAYDDYSAAIVINPVYALAYANRGYLNEQKGRRSQAVADLRRAVLLDPSLTAASEALDRLGADRAIRQESEDRVRGGGMLAGEYCSGCHAIGPDGASRNRNAPEFRNIARRHPLLALREPITRGVVAPHEEMPRIALTDRQIDSIVAYINNLAGQKKQP